MLRIYTVALTGKTSVNNIIKLPYQIFHTSIIYVINIARSLQVCNKAYKLR